jgi:hypothetical protein
VAEIHFNGFQFRCADGNAGDQVTPDLRHLVFLRQMAQGKRARLSDRGTCLRLASPYSWRVPGA